MSKIVIGTNGQSVDLDVLMETRMLIQANSGGGKSYAFRRIAELLFGKVQLIIIDPEGDFATLREKYDFLLVAKDGDIPADVRSAGMLAEKLLELNANAICDLYEMKVHARHEWVKAFLEALINSPKRLWHRCVIMVDEAHIFAPEKGQGESVATESMIDLASRGRKRGFCGIFATQRLGKFSKNVAAELQNVLVGSTFMDIDVRRAAETLGVPRGEERQFSADMKVLEPGNFYALGRALTKERQMVRITETTTTHLRSGAKRKTTPPPPSDKVTAMLSALKDLPAQAEQKILTEAELRKEVIQLRKELTDARKVKANPINVDPLRILANLKIENLVEAINADMTLVMQRVESEFSKMKSVQLLYTKKAKEMVAELKKLKADPVTQNANNWKDAPIKQPPITIKRTDMLDHGAYSFPLPKKIKAGDFFNIAEPLPLGEVAVLSALIQFPDGLRPQQLSVITTYARSSRDTYLSRLITKGLVVRSGGIVKATVKGFDALPNAQPLPTGDALREHWMKTLPEGEAKILQVLIDAYPHSLLREQITEQTGFARSTRDTYLSRMSAKMVIEVPSPGNVKASSNLFDL